MNIQCESCGCALTGKIDTYGPHDQSFCFTCWFDIMDEWNTNDSILREIMWSDSHAEEKSAQEQPEPETSHFHKAFEAKGAAKHVERHFSQKPAYPRQCV